MLNFLKVKHPCGAFLFLTDKIAGLEVGEKVIKAAFCTFLYPLHNAFSIIPIVKITVFCANSHTGGGLVVKCAYFCVYFTK